ncbi:chorismate mutase [Streptomyces sp. NPDC051907]|uniref:chorismate mutase n=1 Tax=Streptomyces sp. NPDC051907 TaxID=3155284 RepID=UPI0034215DDC
MLTQQETAVQTAQAAATVEDLRLDIDGVDAQIRALFERRRELSHAVQRARMAEGGSRTDTGREMKVIKGYADGFGRQGTAISLALLELCRGASPSAEN